MKLVLNILVIMVSLSVLVGYTNESENNIEQSLSAEMEANYLSWDLEPILNAKTA